MIKMILLQQLLKLQSALKMCLNCVSRDCRRRIVLEELQRSRHEPQKGVMLKENYIQSIII